MARSLRNFKERNALVRLAGERCCICGSKLEANWEADHVVPFSYGGETDIANMQALCQTCNRRKGAMNLRLWQQEALERCEQASTDYFVEATPGAGKTTFACTVAKRRINRQAAKRVVVVVPTTTLKKQWADDLHDHGIDAEWQFKTGMWLPDFQAIVVTYQQVSNDAATYRYLSSSENTMVVFDEIHHCGDEQTWGQQMRYAFEKASFRLALSGTPFRSSNDEIPFLRYVDGKAEPDFLYGYGEALRDNICRHVYFPRQGGSLQWITPRGELRKTTFDDSLPTPEENQRLYTALTAGTWLDDTIKSANERLLEMRREDHDAAGLIICIDRFHAKHVHSRLKSLTGVDADVVISEDDEAHSKIERFRNATSPWIIAVKMVSEGVNIKRLRVGIYATNCKTEMFFRQAIGRFVRVEDNHDDPTAVVYIPDDARLREYAETIRRQVVHDIKREQEEEKKRRERSADELNNDCSLFTPMTSTAEHKGTIVDDATFSAEELEYARTVAGGLASAEVTARILLNAKMLVRTEPVPKKTRTKPKSDRRAELRSQNSKLASRIAYATGMEHGKVNARLNESVGITSVTTATVSQLERRFDFASQWLQKLGEEV